MQRVPRILGVGAITAVTFYQWVDLQQCSMKGLVRALEFDGPFPDPIPNRAALVGSFHHRLMEMAATVASIEELDARVEQEIVRLQDTVNSWPHLKRGSSASGWDEVNRSASLARRIISARGTDGRVASRQVEKDLRSRDGRFVGRPDFFSVLKDAALLREFKSGSIRDSSGQPLPVYMDQLRFYAALIFENCNVAEVVGRVESLNGDTFEAVIDRQEASNWAARVTGVIDDINGRINAMRDLGEMARPSKEACTSCYARIVCARFKRAQDGLALEGEQFLLEGFVTEFSENASSAVAEVTIADECRDETVKCLVPKSLSKGISKNGRFVFLNFRRHGTALTWGHTSRVFSCG